MQTQDWMLAGYVYIRWERPEACGCFFCRKLRIVVKKRFVVLGEQSPAFFNLGRLAPISVLAHHARI
jgi:hypothetical protein